MKKVILALAIASVSFAACNSGETKTETPAVDTTTKMAPAPDTSKMAPAPDTSKMAPAADTTKKK
jgi:hypothetical protein